MANYSRYSSVNRMLSTLNWKTLKQRRDIQSLCILYKIINGLVDITPQTCLIYNHLPTRGHSKKFHAVSPSVDAYKFSFYPRVITIWNTLPAYVVDAHDLDSFTHYYCTI